LEASFPGLGYSLIWEQEVGSELPQVASFGCIVVHSRHALILAPDGFHSQESLIWTLIQFFCCRALLDDLLAEPGYTTKASPLA
jgi:hypothetical protein